MREELAVKNLGEVKEILDKLGIKYWLDWGTLLGAVRDGKIIEWDHDIDLGTMDDSWEKLVSAFPEFKKRGFRVLFANLKIYKDVFQKSITLDRFGCPIWISLYQVGDKYATITLVTPANPILSFSAVLRRLLWFSEAEVDQWPKLKFIAKALGPYLSLLPPRSKKLLSDIAWSALMIISDKLDQVAIPKHYFEKLGTIKFYGMTFNIPSDVEGYLECHYGKDWKTPKKEWKWRKDDSAIRVVSLR